MEFSIRNGTNFYRGLGLKVKIETAISHGLSVPTQIPNYNTKNHKRCHPQTRNKGVEAVEKKMLLIKDNKKRRIGVRRRDECRHTAAPVSPTGTEQRKCFISIKSVCSHLPEWSNISKIDVTKLKSNIDYIYKHISTLLGKTKHKHAVGVGTEKKMTHNSMMSHKQSQQLSRRRKATLSRMGIRGKQMSPGHTHTNERVKKRIENVQGNIVNRKFSTMERKYLFNATAYQQILRNMYEIVLVQCHLYAHTFMLELHTYLLAKHIYLFRFSNKRRAK